MPRIPRLKPPDTVTAYEIYHGYSSLDNALIKRLFGCAPSTVLNLKKAVQAEMSARGVKLYNPHNICKKITYELTGLDIEQIDRDYRAMQRVKKEGGQAT